jgi:hypothetical protein
MRRWWRLCGALATAMVFAGFGGAEEWGAGRAGSEEGLGEVGVGVNALGESQSDLVYTPLTPCRIVDTRLAGGAIGAGTTRHFLVTGTDYSAQGGQPTGCGVPYGPTTAAFVNFVAVDPSGLGNLRVTPYGRPVPLAAIVNFRAGQNLANGLAVAICDPSSATCTWDLTVQADVSSTHVVADVQGYFRRVGTGEVGTALLADGAVTGAKIGAGSVVRSLSGQREDVTLSGSGGLVVTAGSGTVTVGSNATASNVADAIVSRDGAGGFGAGTVTLAGNLALPEETSPSAGAVTKGGARLLHTYGSANTFVGLEAGNVSMTGSSNTAVGRRGLYSNTTGGSNTAAGHWALYANTTGASNTASGHRALFSNSSGDRNTAAGNQALYANTTGGFNTAAGALALYQNTTGLRNTALGYRAGINNTTGSDNVWIGNEGLTAESGVIRIGTAGTHTAAYVAGVHGSALSGSTVVVNSQGRLGTLLSSARYKEEIRGMEGESEVLMALRPVSFYYREDLDEARTRQYGLVAEEVAEVAPGLVTFDGEGAPDAVRYHLVNAMLLEEVQRQRRRIEQLEERLARLEGGRTTP